MSVRRELLERLKREVDVTLRYVDYGDAIEGIRPSNPELEYRLLLERIRRLVDDAA